MNKEHTTFGMNPEKLARILNICSDTSNDHGQNPEEKRAELLQSRLGQALPPDTQTIKALPKVLGWLRDSIGTISNESLGKLLTDPKTDIVVIRRIKEYTKSLSHSAQSKIEHDTANAIYYLALAHAIVFNDKKISNFSYEQLRHAFEFLTNEGWIDLNYKNLFTKALGICREKASDREESANE